MLYNFVICVRLCENLATPYRVACLLAAAPFPRSCSDLGTVLAQRRFWTLRRLPLPIQLVMLRFQESWRCGARSHRNACHWRLRFDGCIVDHVFHDKCSTESQFVAW